MGEAEGASAGETASDCLFDEVGPIPAITTHFQSIVDITSGEAVAYEALSRGPLGSPFHLPQALFEQARRLGRIVDLDAACRRSALDTAEALGFTAPHSLFFNFEPESLARGDAFTGPVLPLPYVLEITERALLADPAGLVQSVARARELGYRIAIDDLGAEPASLMLLPLLEPDLVKLDMRLIRGRPSFDVARIMSAIQSYVEESGVVVLAEGIETEKHRLTALAMGATYAQGWLFGRPSENADAAPSLAGVRFDGLRPRTATPDHTPYRVAARSHTPRPSNRRLLVEMSKFLEARAEASGDSTIILSTFQHSENLTPGTRQRYSRLAPQVGLAAVFLDGDPCFDDDSPVRVTQIGLEDPLLTEWDIVVLTADFAAVLAAVEIDPENHREGEYEFILTHDRGIAVDAAKSLIGRMPALPAR